MNFGSLFSGCGGMDAGLEAAGMECAWQCEKNVQCRRVLKRHWPEVECYEDVEGIGGNSRLVCDLLCGGFPCQDLSVAGRRAGLGGRHSGLWFAFASLIESLRPTWVLVENVLGLLSSHSGRDMGEVTMGLGQLGYGWAYRVLDLQWFGCAQRRKHVFIVGHLGNIRRAAEVLFERESMPWDHSTRGEMRASIAGRLASRAGSGFPGTDNACDGYIVGGTHADSKPHIAFGQTVRRLTPRECERLMSFDDDWTRWGDDGKELKDSPRYRMLGNATPPVMLQWIGRRILEIHQCQGQ